jgi:hypothetical protein
MPFLDEPSLGHRCRLPGREVAVGARWFCSACSLIWEFVVWAEDGEPGWQSSGKFHPRRVTEERPAPIPEPPNKFRPLRG